MWQKKVEEQSHKNRKINKCVSGLIPYIYINSLFED
jgi:hypothetical protein